MKKSPVEIGIEYENNVVKILQSCGLTAYRTNKANESDPEQYKAGFDGGVDIIPAFYFIIEGSCEGIQKFGIEVKVSSGECLAKCVAVTRGKDTCF